MKAFGSGPPESFFYSIYILALHFFAGLFSTEAIFVFSYFPDGNIPSGFPRIIQPPSMKAVEKGRNVILVCEATGDPKVNIYWLRDTQRLEPSPRYTIMDQGKLRGERA